MSWEQACSHTETEGAVCAKPCGLRECSMCRRLKAGQLWASRPCGERCELRWKRWVRLVIQAETYRQSGIVMKDFKQKQCDQICVLKRPFCAVWRIRGYKKEEREV